MGLKTLDRPPQLVCWSERKRGVAVAAAAAAAAAAERWVRAVVAKRSAISQVAANGASGRRRSIRRCAGSREGA